MRQPKKDKISCPRLDPKVKDMNGKSTKRLTQCIDALTDLLEDQPQETHETRHDRPVSEDGQ